MTIQEPNTCYFLGRVWTIYGWEGEPDPFRAHVELYATPESTANQRGRTDDFTVRDRMLYHSSTLAHIAGELPLLPEGVTVERRGALGGGTKYLLRYPPRPLTFTGSVQLSIRTPPPRPPPPPPPPLPMPGSWPPVTFTPPIDPLDALRAPADVLRLAFENGTLQQIRVISRVAVGPRDFHADGVWELLDHDHGVTIGGHQVRASTRTLDAANDSSIPEELPPLPEGSELERVNLARTPVSTLDALRTAVHIVKLSVANTRVHDLEPLTVLQVLEELDLTGCADVTDLSPIANIATLRELRLQGTNVRDLSPLANLQDLQHLSLPSHHLELWPLAKLHRLEALDVSGRNVADWSWLAGLAGLNDVDLSRTSFSDLQLVAGADFLMTLRADDTWITTLEPLSACTSLQRVFIKNTRVADLSGIAEAPLEELDITGTDVTDLGQLAGQRTLTILSADETAISDLAPLAGQRKLRSLYLRHTAIADLEPLRKTNLERLDIRGTPVRALEPLQHHQWTLRYLALDARAVASLASLKDMLVTDIVVHGAGGDDVDLAALLGFRQLTTLHLPPDAVVDWSVLDGKLHKLPRPR